MNVFRFIFSRMRNRFFKYDRLQELVDKGLVIGTNPKLMTDWIIDPSLCWLVTIGNDVTFAPRIHILAHDASTKIHFGYTRIGKVLIGDRVFIGASSIVLPNVSIGDDVIIGSGSVVSRDIPQGMVAVGSPARVICSTKEYLGKKLQEKDSGPVFGSEYTLTEGITEKMKSEMNDQLSVGVGYVV